MIREAQKALSIAGIIFLALSWCNLAWPEEEAKEMYRSAYETLLQADMAQKGGEKELAISKWSEALEKLRELQKAHPDWSRMIVGSKIRECETALEKLTKEKAPPTEEGEKAPPPEEGEKAAPVEKPLTELQQYLSKGNELAGDNKYDEAIEEYRKALGVDPNSPVAYLNIATCYQDQDRDDDAVRMLKKALQANPDYARAHFKLGEIYLKKDLIDMAVSEYKKVLQARPDDPVAHWEIAGLYFKIKKLDDSIKHYDRAAELFGETTPEGLEAIRNSEKIKLLKREMGLR